KSRCRPSTGGDQCGLPTGRNGPCTSVSARPPPRAGGSRPPCLLMTPKPTTNEFRSKTAIATPESLYCQWRVPNEAEKSLLRLRPICARQYHGRRWRPVGVPQMRAGGGGQVG